MWMFPFITGSAVSFSHAKVLKHRPYVPVFCSNSWFTIAISWRVTWCPEFPRLAGRTAPLCGAPPLPGERTHTAFLRDFPSHNLTLSTPRFHACALTPSPTDCCSCQLIPPLLGRARKSFRVSGLCLQYDSRTFTRCRFQLDSVEDKSDEKVVREIYTITRQCTVF